MQIQIIRYAIKKVYGFKKMNDKICCNSLQCSQKNKETGKIK